MEDEIELKFQEGHSITDIYIVFLFLFVWGLLLLLLQMLSGLYFPPCILGKTQNELGNLLSDKELKVCLGI